MDFPATSARTSVGMSGAEGPGSTVPARRAYVLVLLLDERCEQILMIRKRRPAWQAGHLNAVGGKIEPGETPLEAAVREVVEETRIELDAASCEPLCSLEGDDPDSSFHIEVFRALVATSELDVAAADPPTDEQLELHSTSALPDSALDNLSWLVPLACHTTERYETFAVIERRSWDLAAVSSPAARVERRRA